MDHAGEGVWGEVFMAALESQAFIESDRPRLLEQALLYIPVDCQVSRVTRLVFHEWKKNTDPVRLRHMVCAEFAHPIDFTCVPLNIGFIIIGFLYGESFGDALCLAVNCGYDTDCTGASLGALLGILATRDGIPPQWLAPVGEKVVVSDYIRHLDFPADIQELSELTAELAHQVLQDAGLRDHLYRWTGLEFLKTGKQLTHVPSATRVRLAADEQLSLDCDYLDDPALGYGEEKPFELHLENTGETALQFRLAIEPPPGVEVMHIVPANGSPSTVSCLLEPHATEIISFTLRVDSQHQHAVDSDALLLTVSVNGKPYGKFQISIIYKTCWLVTVPISVDDVATLNEI